ADASPASGAQTLPASFVLAGYVSSRDGLYPLLEGQAKPFEYAADPVDTYTVPITPGETVTLRNLGSRNGSAEIELRLSNESFVFGAEQTSPDRSAVSITYGNEGDTGGKEDLTVEVSVLGNGPARYILFKAANTQLDSLALDWPSHPFLPGQAIVTLDATDSGSMSSLTTDMANAERHLGGSDWLMQMPGQAATRALQLGQMQAETLSWITQLRQMPGVKDAVPNYQISSMQNSPVDEPLYRLQWHYDLINGPGAWQLSPEGGDGVRVAVLDSGLFSPSGTTAWHPDLNANVVSGKDFVDGDSYPEDPGNSTGASVFHGTHVAGTVAAVVNGEGIGGVSFGASIVPLRVLGEGGTGSSGDLRRAIRWVTGQDDNGTSGPLAEVVNLSLGGLPFDSAIEGAIQYGVDRGVIFVGAAGNSSTSTKSYPAAFDNVLAVSAVDARGRLAPYSNFGSWIDLAAPGGDADRSEFVWSTSAVAGANGFEADYIGLQGTSMATPHVSGVIAMLKAQAKRQNIDLGYSSIRALLEAGRITDYPGSRSDQLGFGILDAAKALRANLNQDLTILSPSPALVSLTNEGEASELVVLNPIGNQLVTNAVLVHELSWVEVSFSGPNSEGQYLISISLVESAIEPDTVYRGSLLVTYDSDEQGRKIRIPITAQILSDENARDAGTHFVLLVNTTPDERGLFWAEAQVVVEATDGSYRFR
ncbi:MAG: S8 family serine peptidase, partial [Actinobacteria bacterium]|nr:S8 family serine peptidase [Actinomycetota bacterium]